MAKDKKTDTDLVCHQCGGKNLEEKAWVDVYTNQVMDGTGDDDNSDRWCRDCEEHIDFITEKEFKANK